MERDKDNKSEEYRLLASRIHNDYISLGNLEETAKKHGIPLSLAKEMIEDVTSPSGASERPKRRKLSIPPENLKEEFMKCGSLKAFADHYGVSVKAASRVLKKYNLSAIKLHKEVTLNKIRGEYLELVRKLGHHPIHKEIDELDGGKHLYNRIYSQYGSLSNFRKAYEEA